MVELLYNEHIRVTDERGNTRTKSNRKLREWIDVMVYGSRNIGNVKEDNMISKSKTKRLSDSDKRLKKVLKEVMTEGVNGETEFSMGRLYRPQKSAKRAPLWKSTKNSLISSRRCKATSPSFTTRATRPLVPAFALAWRKLPLGQKPLALTCRQSRTLKNQSNCFFAAQRAAQLKHYSSKASAISSALFYWASRCEKLRAADHHFAYAARREHNGQALPQIAL